MSDDKKYTLKELQTKLTQKEHDFCHEYITDWNGSRAAKVAGYTAKAPRQAAYDTLTKTYIQQYIAFIKDDIAKEAKISKLALISELKKIAMSDISELYLDWFKMDDFNELKKSKPEILSCIQEINTKTQKVKINDEDDGIIEVEYVKVKMYDKKGAIMDIMKSMGWDKSDAQEEPDTTIVLEFGGKIDMSDYLDESKE